MTDKWKKHEVNIYINIIIASSYRKYSISTKNNYYYDGCDIYINHVTQLTSEEVSSTILCVFGMARPGIEPPGLTLCNTRYVSKVKWINAGKGVEASLTPRCSGYWKESLLDALDYGRQLTALTSSQPTSVILLRLVYSCFNMVSPYGVFVLLSEDIQFLSLGLLSEFFISVLTDGFPPEFERQQVSSSLHDSSQYSGRFQKWTSLDSLPPSRYFQVFQYLYQFFGYSTKSSYYN